jgi:hypothetical protein
MLVLFILLLLLTQAYTKDDVYVLVDDGPQPWVNLLFPTLKLLNIKALFIQNDTSGIIAHQIKEQGHYIIDLNDFVDKTDPDKVIPLVITIINREKTMEACHLLSYFIPKYRSFYNFPNWK